jgi:type VI secretion system protein ImpE
MVTPGDAFKAGDLAQAIVGAQAAVKAAPRDSGARWLLAELLLFAGDAERADRMLDAAVLEEPSPAVLEFRRLLRAEVVRQQVWTEGRAPKFSGDEAPPELAAAMRALVLSRDGAAAEARAEAETAETLRPHVEGTAQLADGRRIDFTDLRDADDVMAPLFEVLTTAGDHLLVPFAKVATLEFEPPRRPRDLCWRRTMIVLRDGTDGVVYAPVIYPGASKLADPLRLGRASDWSDGPGPVRGSGQRMFLVGEETATLLELSSIAFAASS